MKFGGAKEVTGGIDLISSYKLAAHHDFYCKRWIPLSLSDAHYLENIVGDTEIRKGDGMQLEELIIAPRVKDTTSSRIQPFALDILQDAFQLHESAPDDKGVPTVGSKSRSRDKEEKHKKQKEKPRDKESKDKNGNKDKDKDMKNSLNPTDQSQNCQNKKRKKQGTGGLNRQKKSKHKRE